MIRLRKGDIIHLALPRFTDETDAEAAASVRRVVAFYASQGITVALTSSSTLLAHPYVVAVWRR